MAEYSLSRDKITGSNWLARGVVWPGRFIADSFAKEHEHWILWAPVFFGVGVGVYFALMTEPSPWVGPVVVLSCAVLLWFGRGSQFAVLVATAIAFAGTGFSAAQLKSNLVTAPVLERAYGPAPVIGRIVKIERLPRGPRVLLDQVELRRIPSDRTPTLVRLRLHPKDQPVLGERIDVFAKLSPPGRPSLPGGYDFQRRSWFEGLGAVGFSMGRARRPNSTRVDDAADAGIWFRQIRQLISDPRCGSKRFRRSRRRIDNGGPQRDSGIRHGRYARFWFGAFAGDFGTSSWAGRDDPVLFRPCGFSVSRTDRVILAD